MSQVNHDDFAGTPVAEWSSVQELRPGGIGKGIDSVGATRAALLLAAEMAERRRKLAFIGGSGERILSAAERRGQQRINWISMAATPW